jgi:hypothetical protein
MGGGATGGIARTTFLACVLAAIAVVALQSIGHLVVVLGTHRVGTLIDLDRSNGLPDILSTVALGAGAAGAMRLGFLERGTVRQAARALAPVLAVLMLADVLHDGAHTETTHGMVVIGLVCVTGALLLVIAASSTRRVRTTLFLAGGLLVGGFVVSGLDRVDPWFERARGDPIAEYQIVAKEDFEVLGWALVALALWDAASRVVEGFPSMAAQAARTTD